MPADKTAPTPNTTTSTSTTPTNPPFSRPTSLPSTIDDLTEQLSDSKVDHAKDKPMDELASAFGDKWAPNSTRGEGAPTKKEEGEGKRLMELQIRGKEEDGRGEK